jgi:hypothetical protein
VTESQYRIQAGEYAAVVTTAAGALRVLRHGGRDLIVPFPAGGPIPDFRGMGPRRGESDKCDMQKHRDPEHLEPKKAPEGWFPDVRFKENQP